MKCLKLSKVLLGMVMMPKLQADVVLADWFLESSDVGHPKLRAFLCQVRLSDLPRADLVCPTSTAALLRAEARVDADANARVCNALFF
jgi:hypothetical protein